jgi:hypothetical protein
MSRIAVGGVLPEPQQITTDIRSYRRLFLHTADASAAGKMGTVPEGMHA